MKKRLEAELISIAHRVLKLKNKSEVDQLYLESKKLYETLSVLKFYQDHFEQVKASLSQNELEEKLELSFEQTIENNTIEPVIEVQEEVVETVIEETNEVIAEEPTVDEVIEEEAPIIVGEITLEEEAEEIVEESKSELDFEPLFELAAEAPIEDEVASNSTETKQISFEDLLGDYAEAEFVKPNDVSFLASQRAESSSLNEQLSKGINIGLNDRIGFVQHLFGDSNEDFNRVLSQLNTFDTFKEAQDFIENMIKPDYNNWEGQDDYATRFMEIVEKKFV